LSSLSTAEEMVRILSFGTPASSKIPSRIFRWLSCAGVSFAGCEKRRTHLDGKVANVECVQGFDEDAKDFRVGHHGVKVSGDIKVLLSRSAPFVSPALRLTHW
jgi:hypothetical protein